MGVDVGLDGAGKLRVLSLRKVQETDWTLERQMNLHVLVAIFSGIRALKALVADRALRHFSVLVISFLAFARLFFASIIRGLAVPGRNFRP